MAENREYTDGAPCWADLTTPDLAGARRFYGALFDWTFDEPQAEMGHYMICRKHGRMAVGMSPPMPGADMPHVWSVYLKTSDADETARRFTAGGGNLMSPVMEIPGQGRMLFGFDPTGAAIGAWEPGNHRGAQVCGEPGGLCWAEVNTRDGAAADRFYAGLFGYEQQQIGDGEKFDYTVWRAGGAEVCGRMKMGAEFADAPPHWMVYFSVADVDASAEQVRQLGGKVLHGPFDSPYGRIAVVSDPYGATFSLHQENARAA